MIWAPYGSGGWGWVNRCGFGGAPYTCTCTHAHACTCMHGNDHANGHPMGESLGIPYDVIHTCTCMCVLACMCMWMYVGAPSYGLSPKSTHPHPPRGNPRISKNWVCGWMGGSVVQWVGVWVIGWVSGSMGGVRSND